MKNVHDGNNVWFENIEEYEKNPRDQHDQEKPPINHKSKKKNDLRK